MNDLSCGWKCATKTVEIDGVKLAVQYEFSRGEKGGWDSPGEPASLDILSVTVPGSDVDLIGLLNNRQVDSIEEQLAMEEAA